MYEFNLEPNKFFDFIKYQKDDNKLLDSLITEQLHNVPDNTKKKFLELLETL